MNQSRAGASPRVDAPQEVRRGSRKGRFGGVALIVALAFGAFAASAVAGAPMVTTGPATNIGGTGATLVGSVYANGLTTTYYFEYGTTTSYGSSTAPVVLGPTEGGIKLKEITGLTPGVTYHFRVVASNSAGKEVGGDKSFTTAIAWRQLQPPSPTPGKPARFRGVSCPAANSCFAVGDQETTEGSPSAIVELWNGSTWATQSIAGTISSLDGISCLSASNCTAVGYVKKGTETLPAAARYNGTSWSATTVPFYSGATDSALHDVSCTTKGICLAVGYSGAPGSHIPFAVEWSGSSWTLQPVNKPSETASTELTAVSCLAVPYEAFPSIVINKCNAVGWAEKAGSKQAATGFWQEGGWTTMVLNAAPSGAKASQLTGVSCPASSNMNACIATGSYVSSESVTTAYTQSWSGAGWTAPVAGTASLELSGVSCIGSSICEAVGNAPKSGTMLSAAQRYASGTWTAQTPPGVISPGPNGVKSSFVDGGVSCESAGNCMGVGYWEESVTGIKRPLAMYYG